MRRYAAGYWQGICFYMTVSGDVQRTRHDVRHVTDRSDAAELEG